MNKFYGLYDIYLGINRKLKRLFRGMSDSDENGNDSPDRHIENGHFSGEIVYELSHNSGDSDSDGDEQQGPDYIQFDLDLPTSHKYLGKLDEVSGYVWYEDGEITTMVGVLTNSLVFPGFNFPFVLNNDLKINIFQRYTQQKKTFVLLTPKSNFTGIFAYGVIMEIFQLHIRADVLYLKARCRQRCILVPDTEIKPLISKMYQVTVKILSEPPITSPICNTELLALKQKRPFSNIINNKELKKCSKFRKYHYGQYPLPSWIYDQYEAAYLTEKLRKGLLLYYLPEFVPQDPTRLSYWFVQNFQLKHEERLRITVLESTIQRLRLELEYMNTERLICCGNCQADIAKQTNVFPMSKDGVQSNYCNPHGYVYETVTVSKATNIMLSGRPSTQFSWFPGYSWTIMQCKLCHSHLGWKFTSSKLRPDHFYGFAKSGFDIKVVTGQPEEDSDNRNI